MKKLISIFALIATLGIGFSTNTFAEDGAPAVVAATVVTSEAAPVVETAPVAATEVVAPVVEAEVAPAPVPNKGDTAWMLIATILVTLMVIPGLALFYGGLVRQKNMLSVLMQTFMIFSLMGVLWAIYGYSVAFTGGNPFFGGLGKAFLAGITPDSVGATFSKGVVIPELLFVAFQLTFAAITPVLIIGAFAERMKFSAILAFMVLWFTFAYLPMAHMVWYWDGPDAITDAASLETVLANAGWLWAKGALDFAGGTVVHINAGVAGLVGAIMVGKRIGYGKESMAPHSLTLTMVGAALLWVGWFGFNAGSNLEANGYAALALVNTMIATGAATLSWAFAEWLLKGKPSMLGAASGAVAGLVAITPACGFVGPMGAIVIGLLVSPICYFFVAKVKYAFGYDDALDVFGVHAIGGIFGALATGVFVNPALGGMGVYDYVANAVGEYNFAAQMTAQVYAIGTAIVVSATVSFIAFKIVDVLIGLRVSEESEREGLDTTEHGERAYHV
ncbi:MAG: ammonium transporter [Methylotenera sp.]|nr:ammonium transporter [Methylotenera sp.]MDP1755591.1 ammonium transporter [Methylotenera sp.]MDP1959648.1 ammonium transporter [Methylotenera sp.]MDP3207319.1 ammonium transporter [Methylotenera sp.]MDP3302966.1 ammonium transporter [Methylotenera sp.]